MLENENIYFNWFKDIGEYKYFLQSLLLIICNRNLFSYQHFETSPDLLFKSSLWFGRMRIANFSWEHKKHRSNMFVYSAAVQIICQTNVDVSFFVLFFSFSKHNWREFYYSNSSCFDLRVIAEKKMGYRSVQH